MEEYILRGGDEQIETWTETQRPNVKITGTDLRQESGDVMGTDPDGETCTVDGVLYVEQITSRYLCDNRNTDMDPRRQTSDGVFRFINK